MKKYVFSLVLFLSVLFTMHVRAAEERTVMIWPSISFDGTKAICSVTIMADRSTDRIEADIKLWQGDSCVESWTESSFGDLMFTGNTTVAKGQKYILTVDAKINNLARPTVSTSAVCN